MSRIRVAGIGAGYFSRFHLEGWRACGDVDVVGWCDLDAHRVGGLAQEFGVARTFADAESMLDVVAPDLLDIVNLRRA